MSTLPELPGEPLLYEFKFIDNCIDDMVRELKQNGLYDSTLIIVHR